MSEAHDGFYIYEKSVYTGTTDKIVVTCPLHGDFETTFSNHTHKQNPRGCRQCGLESRAKKRTHSSELFLEHAKEAHGDRYDYSLVEYVNKYTKVGIVCKDHGVFYQTPEKHESGDGCPSCAGKGSMTLGRFLQKADKVHSNLYDYSLLTPETFSVANARLSIVCKKHGVFTQSCHNHLHGQGCPKCARFGFNVNKPGKLYILRDSDVVKVGITNRDVQVRVKEVNREGASFKVVAEYSFSDGHECASLETVILRVLRSRYENVDGTFSGSTEAFVGVNLDELQRYINELLKTKEAA